MTIQEAILLLEQTMKRLECEQQHWFRKKQRMSDKNNEKWKSIQQLGDELNALYIAHYYLKEKL